MHVATNKQLVALEIKQLVAIVITETTTTSMAMAACSAGRALARAPVDDPCPRGPGLSRPIDVNRGSSSIAKASAAARRLGHVIAVGLEHDPASLAPSSNKRVAVANIGIGPSGRKYILDARQDIFQWFPQK